jgi:hypothetical protein
MILNLGSNYIKNKFIFDSYMIKSEDLRLGQPRVLETDNNLILPVNK